MKLYRETLRLIIKLALKEGLRIFILSLLIILIFNGLIWLFDYFNLNDWPKILLGIFKLVMYIFLPLYVLNKLIRTFRSFGGGAMIVTFIIMSLEFSLLFILISFISLIFISWSDLVLIFKQPINVIINFS